MVLLSQAAKIAAYVGDFSVSTTVTLLDTAQAGLVFFSDAASFNYVRFTLDASGLGIHKLERVVKGVTTLITDSQAVSVLPFVPHLVSVSYGFSKGLINVTVDGTLIMSVADGTFTAGGAGVFAATAATFASFRYVVPCPAGCTGALNGEVCTFSCQLGLQPSGPMVRTCSAAAGGWLPDPVALPLTCVVPPPTFFPTTISVVETAPTNALVGSPLVATSSAPDFAIAWAIVSETPMNAAIGPIFYIDLLSGQVKLRQSGVMDYVALTSNYTLMVRASIAGYVGATDSFANITVFVIEVDTPPHVAPLTVLTLPENSPYAPMLAIGFASAWDRENSTLSWQLALDASLGLFSVSNASGAVLIAPAAGCILTSTSNTCSSSKLDYESSPGSSFTLLLAASQSAFCCGTAPFAAVAGSVTVQLTDANDAPLVTPGQTLSILSSAAVLGAVVGQVAATDQDSSASAFYGSTIFSLVVPGVQASFPVCAPTVATAQGGFPTDSGLASGSALFAITNGAGFPVRSGVLAFVGSASGATLPSWSSKTVFTSGGIVLRATYTVCVNVTDTFGAWSVAPVTVQVTADTFSTPVVRSFSLSDSYGMRTTGGETVTFNASGFSPGMFVAARYSSASYSYSAACTVSAISALSCVTAPGVGAGLTWALTLSDGSAVPLISALVSSYAAPVVTSVSLNIDSSNTDGTAAGSGVPAVIVFTGQLGTFPPNTSFPVQIHYGASLEYSCNVLMIAADANTTARCNPSVGFGTGLPWQLTVGGQVASSSSYPSWPLFGYGRPTLTSAANSTAFAVQQLSSAGGQLLAVTGTNFGAASSPLAVTFGTPSGSKLVPIVCTRGANPHTQLSCPTPPGIGALYALQVSLGAQTLVAPFGGTALLGFSYAPPIITSVTGLGQKNGPTSGNALLQITGENFGPVSGVLGMTASDMVTYGHVGATSTFVASGCMVVSSPDQGLGATSWTMNCVTAPGVGAGLSMSMALGGQAAPTFAANIAYGAPQVVSFAGVGAANPNALSTLGGSSVYVNGLNFGPGPSNPNYASYFAPKLAVQYGAALQGGPVSNLTFSSVACTVSVPDVQLQCVIAPGAGHNLIWRVTLDGQASAEPTTSYAAPVVTGITTALGAQVTAANVNGGDIVWIVGQFYGPTYQGRVLVQSITYGPSGTEQTLAPSLYSVTSQTQISAKLPPGSGQNLHMVVTVADQRSPASVGTFSYAVPSVLAVVPARAPTFSNPLAPTIITLVAQGLPLLDPTSRFAVALGQGAYAQQLALTVPTVSFPLQAPFALPAYIAVGAGGSINVSFALPRDGAAVLLGISILVFQDTASASPLVSTPVTSPAQTFSYLPPLVPARGVVATRALFFTPAAGYVAPAADFVPCPFPTSLASSWNCTDPGIFMLTFSGSNFGADPFLLAAADGVVRQLQMVVTNYTALGIAGTPTLWASTSPGAPYDANPLALGALWLYSWSHTRIIAFAHTFSAQLQVVLTTTSTYLEPTAATSSAATQAVAPASVASLSPSITNVSGATAGIPATGATAATISESHISTRVSLALRAPALAHALTAPGLAPQSLSQTSPTPPRWLSSSAATKAPARRRPPSPVGRTARSLLRLCRVRTCSSGFWRLQ